MKKTKLSDQKLLSLLKVDAKTLARFKEIRKNTILEAAGMGRKKNKKVKVLGISGSARAVDDMARQESNSEALLKISLRQCSRLGAQTELIKLRDFRIEHCRACYSTANTH